MQKFKHFIKSKVLTKKRAKFVKFKTIEFKNEKHGEENLK
jgi:hypothetical protein